MSRSAIFDEDERIIHRKKTNLNGRFGGNQLISVRNLLIDRHFYSRLQVACEPCEASKSDSDRRDLDLDRPTSDGHGFDGSAVLDCEAQTSQAKE